MAVSCRVSTISAKSDFRCAIVTSKIARADRCASGRSKPSTASLTTLILKPRSEPARTVVLTQKPATAPYHDQMRDANLVQIAFELGGGKGRRRGLDEDGLVLPRLRAGHRLVSRCIFMERRTLVGLAMTDMDDRPAGGAEGCGKGCDILSASPFTRSRPASSRSCMTICMSMIRSALVMVPCSFAALRALEKL